MNNYIKIFDTTLRDGEQSPGFSMNLQEKIRMARQLEKLKVDVIEAGFPIASPEDFESVKEIAKICKHAEICGLARTLEKDIKICFEAIQDAKKPRIHTFIATSDLHMKYKLKKTPEEILEMAIKGVKFAKSLCQRVDFSPEDAVRSQRDFLYTVIEATIEAGADTINIPDTVGYSTPEEFGKLINDIIKNVPNISQAILSTHCHDDLGLAVANSLQGIKNGARQIECTINGIGERAGNAALEEVVMAIHTRKDFYDFKTGINTKEIYPTSQLLSAITGIPVQPNKAIVGANAFAHESGIHQDGVLKHKETYEILTPEAIGLEKNKIVLGKHSGRHALLERCKKLGIHIEDDQISEIFEKFKKLADKKKEVFDEDLLLLVDEKDVAKDSFHLKNCKVECGTQGKPSASVQIEDEKGEIHEAKYEGSGPVDSIYGAINSIVKLKNTLLKYSVNAVTEGIDAQATVAACIKVGKKLFFGNSGDTDIVVASARSYLSALNKALREGDKKK